MANLIAVGGNFTTAGSWGTVESVSELDSEAGNTAVSTSNLDTATFIPAATALDAVALKFHSRIASPTGTFTVTLRNSTAGTDAQSVTVNVSDIPLGDTTNVGLGWITFKFASTETPNGTDSYLIRVVCSNTGSQVTLYRNATASNWSRKLRTTTTQAPAAGNHLVISNEFLGAASANAVTITMDNIATTSFGPTVSGGPAQGIVVSGNGTLTFGVTASTAYYLRWKGIF